MRCERGKGSEIGAIVFVVRTTVVAVVLVNDVIGMEAAAAGAIAGRVSFSHC